MLKKVPDSMMFKIKHFLSWKDKNTDNLFKVSNIMCSLQNHMQSIHKNNCLIHLALYELDAYLWESLLNQKIYFYFLCFYFKSLLQYFFLIVLINLLPIDEHDSKLKPYFFDFLMEGKLKFASRFIESRFNKSNLALNKIKWSCEYSHGG